jgi:hypothetical protein
MRFSFSTREDVVSGAIVLVFALGKGLVNYHNPDANGVEHYSFVPR